MNCDDRPNKVRILPIYQVAKYPCQYPQRLILQAERCLLQRFSLEGQENGIRFGADMQVNQRAGRAGQGSRWRPGGVALTGAEDGAQCSQLKDGGLTLER